MRWVAVLFWMLAFVAQPASAASSPSLQNLEQQLASLAAAAPGDVGVAALDLKTGELVSVRGDEPFPMASTVKIAVAANYLAQVEHGRRSLDDRISGRSARSLMEAMIIRSDNHATDVIIRDLMARCKTGKNRIRGLLPLGTHVENKTGTLNGLTTDVGFITLPDGRRL